MATTNPANLPGAPVDPGQAQGAQIPLQSFNIPGFPPSAKGLKALTLTSDIKVDQYQTILSQPFSIPDSIPFGVESLTLELFSLGYPPGFLSKLAERLPNLKSVVVYSQLFAGLTEESRKDAVEFFKRLPNLRALHFLDVFAKEKFFSEAAEWLKYNTSETPGEARRGLMFVEINYTFQHDDDEFMQRIQAKELPLLVGPGLISASFNLASPEPQDQQQSSGQTKEGVMAFNQSLAAGLVEELTETDSYPRGLRALNSTLYTMGLDDLDKVLSRNKNVMVLNVTLETEPGSDYKKKLLATFEKCASIEQVEVIANPTMQFFMASQEPRSDVLAKTFPSEADLDALSQKCPKLKSFKANVLRTSALGLVNWERKDGKWKGGVNTPR